MSEERIKELETLIDGMEKELLALYDANVEATRFLSDEARGAVLETLVENVEGDRSEARYALLYTDILHKGLTQCTDEELIVEWFESFGGGSPDDPDHYSKSDLWQNHLSVNLGAIKVVADLMEKQP